MLSGIVSYHKPRSVGEARRLLRKTGNGAALLAGGTSLLAQRNPQITALIDLSGLGLDYIRLETDRLEIGAMTTLQAIVESPLLADFAGGLLAGAAHDTATRTVRNVATVGGSIAACGLTTDVTVALLALGATVATDSGRILSLDDVLAGKYPTRLPRLFTEIHIDGGLSAHRSAFLRVARLPSDEAIVNLAAVVQTENGVCRDIRLAAGGVAAKPMRLHVAEAVLRGSALDDATVNKAATMLMQAVNPPSDIRGSSEYRRAMLGVLLRRAVRQYRHQQEER